MKIGIVGSRTFKDYAFLEKTMDAFLEFYGSFLVVSGGAEGADTLAVRWANNRDLPWPVVYNAYWFDLNHPDAVIKTRSDGTQYDAMAGFRRNQQIVNDVDLLVAFMDEKNPTPGTSDTIQRAKKKGTPVMVFWPENNHG